MDKDIYTELLVDLNELIDTRDYKFYAHRKNDLYENLLDHIKLTNKYFFNIVKSKNIFTVFNRIWMDLGIKEEYKIFYYKLILNVTNFHDIGKINTEFQKSKMKNIMKDIYIKGVNSSEHSLLSSVLYISYFINEICKYLTENEFNEKEICILINVIYSMAFVISKHHGNIDKFTEYLNKNSIEQIFEEIKLNKIDTIKDIEIKESIELYRFTELSNDYFINKNENNKINEALFTLTRLMYSLLVASDYYATSEFMNNFKETEFGEIKDINSFKNKYEDLEFIKNIRAGKNNTEMNSIRSEIFMEAERNLLKNINKNIFFLEAPTGSGKSNTAMNLSFKLLDEKVNKIFYIYPFNTLVEQNMQTILKLFKEDQEFLNQISVVNSINPLKENKNKNFIINKEKDDYSLQIQEVLKTLMDSQFMNYPFVITTHVKFFDIVNGYKKESVMPFYQLIGSVIVIDEIQAYKDELWPNIIKILDIFSKYLNFKIIIMSATLPELGNFINEKEKICNLIDDSYKYFNNSIFKNRVHLNYDLLNNKELKLEDLLDHIDKNSKFAKKILIEFISKKTAREFYYIAKDYFCNKEREILIITGDDNIASKKQTIDIINTSEKPILVIGTQVIEAGVDIDMDIGYKDISTPDLDEQFLGRINRSSKKSGIAYFFDYDKILNIYKNIAAVNKMNILNDEYRNILENKDFKNYYSKIVEFLKDKSEKNNGDFILSEEIKNKNYYKICENMKIINDNIRKISVFFNDEIEIEELDENYHSRKVKLNGSEIWNRYKEYLNESVYELRIVNLKKIRAYMNYFIYQVNERDFYNITYNDLVGDIYYVENKNNYFKDGLLNIEETVDFL